MAKKGFKRIDMGYHCAPNYEGYGWIIEGETYHVPHTPCCYVDVPYKMGKELDRDAYYNYDSDWKFIVHKVGKFYSLGFFRVGDAKRWCIANAR